MWPLVNSIPFVPSVTETVNPLERWSILRNTDPDDDVSPDLPFPLYLLPSLQENQEWPRPDPEEHRGSLSVALSVQCLEDRMVVSVNKESLQVNDKECLRY